MRKTFKNTKLRSVLAFMVGLIALSAAAARAEGAEWRVNGEKITNALEVQGQATLDSPTATLLVKVGLSKVEISCTALKFRPHALLKESGTGEGKGGVEECVTKLNGVVAKACVPHSVGASNGLIETNLIKAKIVSESTVELTPVEGKVFVTLVLGKSAPEKNECSIGEKFDITGKVVLVDCQNEGSVEKVTHLVEEGPSSEILFGANPATIDGSANVFLIGMHEGMTVSGIF